MHVATALPDGRHVAASAYQPWEQLCTVGYPALEVTDEIGNGYRQYTTKLTAVLAEAPSYAAEPMAYRATCADGTQVLIGVDYAPYPLVTISDAHPSTPSEKCACTLTVTWTAPMPALIIV